MEEFITKYGYLALFAGVFLEGESVVIAAAFAAHQGYLDLKWVILAAFLGSLAGDEFYFFLGRYKGRAYLRRRPQWQARIHKVQDLMERYHRLIIVGFRFLYGLRTVTPFALGMSEVKAERFIVFNTVGALVWSTVMALLGFLFSNVLDAIFEDLKKHEHWIMAGILAAGAAGWIIHRLRKRRHGKGAAR